MVTRPTLEGAGRKARDGSGKESPKTRPNKKLVGV